MLDNTTEYEPEQPGDQAGEQAQDTRALENDAMIKVAASYLIDRSDRGNGTNIARKGDKPDQVIEETCAALYELGVRHGLSEPLREVLGAYVDKQGRKYLERGPSQLYTRIIVADSPPEDLPDLRDFHVVIINARRKSDLGATNINLRYTNTGTAMNVSEEIDAAMFSELQKEKSLIIIFGTLSSDSRSIGTSQSVDQNAQAAPNGIGEPSTGAVNETADPVTAEGVEFHKDAEIPSADPVQSLPETGEGLETSEAGNAGETNPVPDGAEADASGLDVSQPEAPQAESQQGEPSQANGTESNAPQAEALQGDAPQAEAPQGDAPQAESQQGEPSQANGTEGDAPKTEVPKAEAPQGKPSQANGTESNAPQAEISRVPDGSGQAASKGNGEKSTGQAAKTITVEPDYNARANGFNAEEISRGLRKTAAAVLVATSAVSPAVTSGTANAATPPQNVISDTIIRAAEMIEKISPDGLLTSAKAEAIRASAAQTAQTLRQTAERTPDPQTSRTLNDTAAVIDSSLVVKRQDGNPASPESARRTGNDAGISGTPPAIDQNAEVDNSPKGEEAGPAADETAGMNNEPNTDAGEARPSGEDNSNNSPATDIQESEVAETTEQEKPKGGKCEGCLGGDCANCGGDFRKAASEAEEIKSKMFAEPDRNNSPHNGSSADNKTFSYHLNR